MTIDDVRAMVDLPLVGLILLAAHKVLPMWLKERERDRQWRTQEREYVREDIRRMVETITRHDSEDLARVADIHELLVTQNERIAHLLSQLNISPDRRDPNE